MIVLDADDLDSLVDDVWNFRTYTTGQARNSNKRMIVRSEVFDDFVAKITAKAESVGIFSPLSSRKAAETPNEQVQDAISKGRHHPGHAGLPRRVVRPGRGGLRVDSDEEALELANDTVYGLAGSVFSTDRSRVRRLAERLEVGMASVNATAAEGAEIPFGGVKRSGFGRQLGPLGMDEFANKRMFYIAKCLRLVLSGQLEAGPAH